MTSGSFENIHKALKESSLPFVSTKSAVGFSKFQFIGVHNKSHQLRLLLLFSWDGPFDGYTSLIDLDGIIYDTKKVGYIKGVRIENPSQETYNNIVIIDAIQSSGTGARKDHFIIFDISSDKLNPIFNETSYELSFPGQLVPDENYELNATLYFELLDKKKYLIYELYRTDYRWDTTKSDFVVDRTKKLTPKAFTFSRDKFEEIKDIKILNQLFFYGKE